MRDDPALIRIERNLWLGATTATIGILLLMTLQTRPERRDGTALATSFNAPRSQIENDRCHPPVVDPDDRQRLYLGTDIGVMVSIDGGRTWMTEETGLGPAVTMRPALVRTPAGQKQ
jgi:hypothetical protein